MDILMSDSIQGAELLQKKGSYSKSFWFKDAEAAIVGVFLAKMFEITMCFSTVAIFLNIDIYYLVHMAFVSLSMRHIGSIVG